MKQEQSPTNKIKPTESASAGPAEKASAEKPAEVKPPVSSGLDSKDYLHYAIFVPVSLWAVYKTFGVYQQSRQLVEDHKDCVSENPNQMALFIGTMVICAIAKFPVQNFCMRLVEPMVPAAKFPLGSEARTIKTEMLAERLFRLVVYVCRSLAAYLILKDSQYLQKYLGGELDQPNYYANYPCIEEPAHLDDFYMICLTYQLFETLVTIAFHRNRYDFSEYLLHHFVTLVLIGYSYILKKLTLGCVTMMVMDFSDIFVSFFKITVDIHERLVLFTYAGMVAAWVYFRLFFFPIYVIKEHYLQGLGTGHPTMAAFIHIETACLCVLHVLNLFWFWLMVKGVYRRINSSKEEVKKS